MTDLYFKVLKSSPIMPIIARCKKQLVAHNKGVRAFITAAGFPKDRRAFGTNTHVIGIEGKTDRPGWRYDHRKGCSVPAKNTPAGKQIAARMKEIPPGVDWSRVSNEVFDHGLVIDAASGGLGFCSYHAVFGWNPKGVTCAMNASVKKAAKTWPKGLKELTGTQAEKLNGKADE